MTSVKKRKGDFTIFPRLGHMGTDPQTMHVYCMRFS